MVTVPDIIRDPFFQQGAVRLYHQRQSAHLQNLIMKLPFWFWQLFVIFSHGPQDVRFYEMRFSYA